MLGPPAPASILLTWSVERDTDLRGIRDGLRRSLTQRTADRPGDRAIQQMGLVATELAGNALRHGRPPAVVRLLVSRDCYIVDVSDSATGDPPRPAPSRPGIHAGGRGLAICLSLAEQVCWYTTGTAKHIWASFPRTGEPAEGR